MNIHLPAILMWTTGVQGFDTLPYAETQECKVQLCQVSKQTAENISITAAVYRRLA